MLEHLFHIPVMGIGYTLDTPIKVAKYGISSAISIVQDDVLEKVRKHYSSKYPGITFEPIKKGTEQYRSRRIMAYLNLLYDIIKKEFEQLKNNPQEVKKYFSLLPQTSDMSQQDMMKAIRHMQPGNIDVNVMTKVDRPGMKGETSLSEACSAVLGFVRSDLSSSLILSAGLNQRLFSFMEQFEELMPNKQGKLKKKVTLKVSDYRSAYLQGKILAKKGIWVSEFRIESGLNCGGHAFATQGHLLGPILEEFCSMRASLASELGELCNQRLAALGRPLLRHPHIRITVQGGIGTSQERAFLHEKYQVDSTGWGSPFLLVPEATSIDDETLKELINADVNDIYQSNASPLGIKFNTIRQNNADRLRQKRIAERNPGGLCSRKHLALAVDREGKQACTASRQHQKLLIDQLCEQDLSEEAYQRAFNNITSKECLCNGLALSLLNKLRISDSTDGQSISVCPGPNLAYFDRTYTLHEMVDHIYGKLNIINKPRPNFLIKELSLYLKHLDGEMSATNASLSKKAHKYFDAFIVNLTNGINYYFDIIPQMFPTASKQREDFEQELARLKTNLLATRSNLQRLKNEFEPALA